MEHALETGQPNLAELYRRRYYRDQPFGPIILALEAVTEQFNAIGKAFRTELTQDDFALINEPDDGGFMTGEDNGDN